MMISRWRWAGVLVALVVAVLPQTVRATQVTVAGTNAKTILLPGGFAALVDPTDDSLYVATGDQEGEFSYPVIFDLGASGLLMSNFVHDTLGVPTTGESFSDIGIGGVEQFDVSVPTRLMLTFNTGGEAAANNFANYIPLGEYKFQIKHSDPSGGPVDLVGTPVLRNYVMDVQPNAGGYQSLTPYLVHMKTELKAEMPSLPSQGVYSIPIEYKSFFDQPLDSYATTVEENPVIPGVRILDDRNPGDQQAAPRDWLLDTGASLTLINETYATEIGIDLVNDPVVNTAVIEGVGSAQQTLNGYLVDKLVLPMLGGDELAFTDVTIFVIPDGDNPLPADLPGILGMNLLGPSFNTEADLLTGVIPDSEFDRWYVDSPNNMFHIVDYESTYVSPVPEPAAMFTIALGLACFRRRP